MIQRDPERLQPVAEGPASDGQANPALLSVRDLRCGYGQGGSVAQVLQGVDFDLYAGETVCLLGRNGSGRSTLVKALMGLLPWQGRVLWQVPPAQGETASAQSMRGWAPHRIARAGLGYVPESRDVFERLSVEQNLLLGVQRPAWPWRMPRWAGRSDPAAGRLEAVYAMFPSLAQRRHAPAGVLSGGEQQMLSLGRTWMGTPRLMLVDEPTEGLAPQVVDQLAQFFQQLRSQGVAVLLVEQKLTLARQVAPRALVMGQGRIVWDGGWDGLAPGSALRREWLEV
jgi:branched-chain amino acid transport system ATP-binding protein